MNPSDVIEKWRKLYSVYDPNAEDSWLSDIRKMNNRIKLAMSLDESNLTTLLIIENVVDDYLKGSSITLGEFVKDPMRFTTFFTNYNDLIRDLNHPDIIQARQRFIRAIQKGIQDAGFGKSPKLDKFFKDHYSFAQVRLSALNSFKTLRVDQFSKGENTTVGKLNFVNDIYEFYDVNIMLRAMTRFPDGMYLALIRDIVDDRFSYFAFVIRNGANLYLVSDKPELPSVNYKHCGRTKSIDRSFSGRVDAHYFPYNLLDVKWDEDQSVYKIIHDDYATAVRLYADNWKAVGKISDGEPAEIAWIFMLFALFQDRYFSAVPYLTDGLSYTAAMINIPSNQKNVNALVKVDDSLVQYQPLDMAPLTVASLTNDNPEVMEAWVAKPTGKNAWMEERYSPQVPDDLVAGVIAPPGTTNLMVDEKCAIMPTQEVERINTLDYFARQDALQGKLSIPGLELNTFGTEKEVKQSLYWHARNAKIKAIKRLMHREHDERKKEIHNWYQQALEANRDAILKYIAEGQLLGSVTRYANILRMVHKDTNLLVIHTMKNGHWGSGHAFASKRSSRYPYRWCYLNGAVASYFFRFCVSDVTTISQLTGIKEADLPVFIRNLPREEVQSGNPILNTLDPLDSLENPWQEDDWDLVVFLSKTGYKQICKQYGTQPRKIEEE